MTSRCFAFGSRNSRGKAWERYPDRIVFHFDLFLSYLFPHIVVSQMGLLKISKDLLSKFPWSFPTWSLFLFLPHRGSDYSICVANGISWVLGQRFPWVVRSVSLPTLGTRLSSGENGSCSEQQGRWKLRM